MAIKKLASVCCISDFQSEISLSCLEHALDSMALKFTVIQGDQAQI